MTEQERFEEIVSSEPFAYSTEKNEFGYKLYMVNQLRAMWTSARIDAYQEAFDFFNKPFVDKNEKKTP